MKCERLDCVAQARYQPRLSFMPLLDTYTGPPATMDIGLHVCRDHATDEDAEELLETFWPAVVDVCKTGGRAAPDVRRSRVTWETIQ